MEFTGNGKENPPCMDNHTRIGMNQQTLSIPVSISGTGLHSGEPATVTVSGAPENTGIIFIRSDLAGALPLAAHYRGVRQTDRCMALGDPATGILTVEHLLAAALGMGIDNLKVEVQGPELPALDGSARPYVEAFSGAGIEIQPARRAPIEVTEPLFVRDNGALLMALPHQGFRITYVINFKHPLVGTQWMEEEIGPEVFVDRIAPARTFGFWEEVEALHQRNLALGGSLDNALVIFPDHFSSELRFADEPVRHKALDLIGDLALLGRPLQGHVVALKASHRLHLELVKALGQKEGIRA